jgi:hypothetical protein
MMMRNKRKKEVVLEKDLSNRVVVLVLILVILVSVISLGIYVATVQEIQDQQSGPANLVVDMSSPSPLENFPSSTST